MMPSEPALQDIIPVADQESDDDEQTKRDYSQGHEAGADPECSAGTDQASCPDAYDRDIRNHQQHGPAKLLDVSPGGARGTTHGFTISRAQRTDRSGPVVQRAAEDPEAGVEPSGTRLDPEMPSEGVASSPLAAARALA